MLRSQVVFEGIRGESWAGDIALDDISVIDGACPPQLVCTFEDKNLCGWSNVHGDNFDWTRANGRTASSGTGPSLDHTYLTDLGKCFVILYLLQKVTVSEILYLIFPCLSIPSLLVTVKPLLVGE
mgnify:CR=1 FL=1